MTVTTYPLRDEHGAAVAPCGCTPAGNPLQNRARSIAFYAALDPIEILSVVRDDRGAIIDFGYEDVNPAFCRLTGRCRRELIGRRMTEVFPGVSPKLLEVLATVAETGTPSDLQATEYASVINNGAPRLFDLRVVQSGVGLLVTFRDVTEITEQSERLRRSERRFRLISQNTHDLVLAFANDVITWASPSTQDLLGYTPEELVGRRWSSFAYGDGRDLQALDDANIDDARLQGRVCISAKDGSCHWISVAAGPDYDDNGNRIGTLASASLADREVAAENAIRELLEQRGRILEQVPVGVFRVSIGDDGMVNHDYANRLCLEILNGQPECPLSLVIVGRALGQAELAELTTSAHAAARAGAPLVCEKRQPGGRWVRIEAHVEEAPGGLMVLDGIVEDITLTKTHDAELEADAKAATEQADQLARSLAFKSAVLSAVGHDLRTPLAVLSSSASALGDAASFSASDRAELVDNIRSSAQSLEALVSDLLDVQRIDVGAIEVRSEAVLLLEVLEDALRHLPIPVDLQIPADFPAIEADAGLLARVLENLLRNAALHSRSDRPVKLTATREDGQALISVVDHGVGVPEDQLSRLFEPFHRLRNDAPGAGVGLWIAQQFARAMGMALDPGATPDGGLTMTLKARLHVDPTACR